MRRPRLNCRKEGDRHVPKSAGAYASKPQEPGAQSPAEAHASEDPGLHGHDFLEFRIFLKARKLRFFYEFLALLEAFLKRFADIVQGLFEHSGLCVTFGQVVKEHGAVAHGAVADNGPYAAAAFENRRIERQCLLIV